MLCFFLVFFSCGPVHAVCWYLSDSKLFNENKKKRIFPSYNNESSLHDPSRAENPHTQHSGYMLALLRCVLCWCWSWRREEKNCGNFPSLALHCSCVGNGHADTRKQHNINFLWEFSIKLIVFLNIIFVSMPRGETYPSYTRALSALCYREKSEQCNRFTECEKFEWKLNSIRSGERGRELGGKIA